VAQAKKKKIDKSIKIDTDTCNGCRACEVACAIFHSKPQYSGNNPARSRIRVLREPLRDIFVPVFAGEYTPAECAGKNKYVIDGKEYDDCALCRASCPSRDLFKEPDSGLPLKCDMCESDPDLDEPWCVKWCLNNTLTYEVEEVEEEEAARPDQMEIGLGALVDEFGLEKVLDALDRMANNAEGKLIGK
jgi:benzoyl-CoA reductase subunit BamC